MRDTSLPLLWCFLPVFIAYAGELPDHYDLAGLHDDVVVATDTKGLLTINGHHLVVRYEDTPKKWEVWPGWAKRHLNIQFISLTKSLVLITDGEDEKYDTFVDLDDVHGDFVVLRHWSTLLKDVQSVKNKNPI